MYKIIKKEDNVENDIAYNSGNILVTIIEIKNELWVEWEYKDVKGYIEEP